MRIMQLVREGSPPPGLRPPQAELSRKSNQVARAGIRRFESDMPSQAVRSRGDISGLERSGRCVGGSTTGSNGSSRCRDELAAA